jgi:hypothetical protein
MKMSEELAQCASLEDATREFRAYETAAAGGEDHRPSPPLTQELMKKQSRRKTTADGGGPAAGQASDGGHLAFEVHALL